MNPSAHLSERECNIAELLAWGATQKDIANRLFISQKTVENHVRHIYTKTGVTKVNEFSAWFFCTHYNISFTLSPLTRSITALVFLLLFCSYEYSCSGDVLRTVRRTEQVRTRARRNEITIEI